MNQLPTKHRSVLLFELIDAERASGKSETEAMMEGTLRLKTDHPEYFPVHRDAQGKALTLEAVVSDHLRNGIEADRAFRIATSDARMTKNYYDRARIGAGWIESVFAGHLV